MRTFKAALFDLDGTLIDTEDQYTEIWGAIARRFRPDFPGLEFKIKGTTLVQILERYFPDKQVHKELVEMLDKGEAGMEYKFFPGALDFIADIRKHGVKCAIVTSSNQQKMKAVEKAVPNFYELFDKVLTSEDFSASKPDPDCYLKGADVFGCSVNECVVFEDAFTGLEAGMSSGCFTFGLTTCNSAESIKDKCHYVLDGFEGLSYEKVLEILKSAKGL